MKLVMMMKTKNEMSFWCRRHGIRKQGEMMHEGMGHALAVPDTGNGTARKEMEIEMKMSVSPSCPRWGPGRI